ncbi:flagellar biosynthesis protein FlhF [Billgrantia gudaonensis]|uniref:Flagellar biosynthesis protein FlhF n=1 Tax=Billgrantia gudaonensis TaxID=376427 RepID=A0A1G9D5N9_9GAMM|nr:flagellar biosynthesis protein FlhF [Halomonas gudaonensis]SDK58985.1 flagellar biosynthesis protein FlhF [Halomonas gudaonensis]
MSVMRFTGANSRDAMRQVREALGDEALILANRRTDSGVEILAMAESAAPGGSGESATPVSPAPREASASSPASSTSADSAFAAMSEKLLEEMRDMRALLARDQPGRETPAGLDGQVRELLLGVGFGTALADEIVAALPDELVGTDIRDDRAMAWVKRQLVQRLAGLDDEARFLDRTGVVALIGPTGVGKTTTTAKLAARYVMRHGTRPVALVTTDSFRIGAHEQLRIYARLLDVPMFALTADQPVNDLLGRMQGKSWVIIDTVGMSQRDHRIIEQVGHLRGGTTPVRLVLLLNAASQPETLEEVVQRYRQAAQAAGAELNDCVITKHDEAGRLAPALDVVMRHGLRLLFVSHGQRVPEDMSLAEPPKLIDEAFAQHREAASSGADSVPHQASAGRTPTLMGQGRRLAGTLQALRQRLDGFDELERVWDLLGLPAVVQQQRLDELLADYPGPERALGMLWSERRRVSGASWAMPDIALNADGDWLALPLLQHRQVAGQQPRLAEAEGRLGASVHLMAGLPDAVACQWLESRSQSWVSQVRGSQRVEHAGERDPLKSLAALAEPLDEAHCRFRGMASRLKLATLAVNAMPRPSRRGDEGLAVQAWFAEVRDAESGRLVARRYWLTPARLGRQPVPLLLHQLQGDGLALLTRRAWQRIEPQELGELRPDVRLLLASGTAAVATHLDLADDEAAMDLRAELLGLAGGRRRRRDVALMEALVELFLVRDAIRHLGLGEREAG